MILTFCCAKILGNKTHPNFSTNLPPKDRVFLKKPCAPCDWTTTVYLTIISRGRVGYEMIDSQRGAWRWVDYNHLISNKPEWNNCFIKNNHQISLKSCHVLFRKILSWTAKRFSSAAIVSLRGKKFQNFSCCADAYTYHICRAWYN